MVEYCSHFGIRASAHVVASEMCEIQLEYMVHPEKPRDARKQNVTLPSGDALYIMFENHVRS